MNWWNNTYIFFSRKRLKVFNTVFGRFFYSMEQNFQKDKWCWLQVILVYDYPILSFSYSLIFWSKDVGALKTVNMNNGIYVFAKL